MVVMVVFCPQGARDADPAWRLPGHCVEKPDPKISVIGF